MLRIDETWVGGGTVNCWAHAIREEPNIRSAESNSRRAFDVVIGQGLSCGGWIKQDSRKVSSALWSGVASQ